MTATQPRIVSLICSATEIVAALGHRDGLVGRSHECDYPPGVEALPVLTAPRFDTGGASADIDRRVKDIVGSGLAVYDVDEQQLHDLAPDVIVTQDQCDVCAVSLADVEAAVCGWTGRDTRIVSLKPEKLADVWDDIGAVARAVGAEDNGARLIAELKERIATIAARAQALPDRPRVAVIEWIDPLMAGGNWMPELVALAGGANRLGEAGAHSDWITWAALAETDPEVIVVAPCGYDIDRAAAEMPSLEARPGWGDLSAVRNGRVAIADGHQFFNRPGPRLVESLEILAEIVHPDAFDFGWKGRGWRAHDRAQYTAAERRA
jgi:iron complex transport system substrate-binding protein